MKRPTMLIQAILQDARVDLDLSIERDIQTIECRFEHEGLSFLTITLPVLSDALERGLEDGRFTCPSAFQKQKHGRLPRFLGGFFNRVFDKDGVPLKEIDANAIFYIRQVCRFFKKMRLACTADRETSAEENFLSIEEELRNAESDFIRKDIVLDRVSGIIWSQVFPEIDPMALIPRHGPGSTSDRLSPNQRFHLTYWYDRFEQSFPSDLFAFANYGRALENSGSIGKGPGMRFLSVGEEPPVRVVFVPKTQTSPRVIAIEPSSMQYVQQSMLSYIVEKLESHDLTKHSIRFGDQSVNQRLALKASKDRLSATIDLKDASDRVSNLLVQRIFKSSGIAHYLEDARSLHATLPSGRNIILSKYASMGSALCFPVEAMCFYTLIQSAMHKQDGRRPTSSSIRSYSRGIDIFGDDIIVPNSYVDAVVSELESFKLRVNSSKSFRYSLFRESCGGDYYNGIAVKPVYARELLPERRSDWTSSMVISWTAKANEFYQLGLWRVCQRIREMVEWVTKERIPIAAVNRGSGLFFTSVFQNTQLRYNPSMCGWEQRRIVFNPVKQPDDHNSLPEANLNKWAFVHASRFSKEHSRCLTNVPSQNRGSSSNNTARKDCLANVPLELVASTIVIRKILEKKTSPMCDVLSLSSVLSTNSKVKRSIGHKKNWSLSFDASFGVVAKPQGFSDQLYEPAQSQHRILVKEPFQHEEAIRFGRCVDDFFMSIEDMKEQAQLDFKSSVKRGGFKSKRRWVTLIT